MSLITVASKVETVKANKAVAPKTPRPWNVYSVLLAQYQAEGMDEATAKRQAEEKAIEGFFGEIVSIEDLEGLLLGLGYMVATAARDDKGYVKGLKTWGRPYRAMFSMAMNARLPSADDFSLLMTWADVLHGSDPALTQVVTKVRAAVVADPREAQSFREALVKAQAQYKASKVKA